MKRHLLFTAALGALSWGGCELVQDKEGEAPLEPADFRIVNEFSGWAENSGDDGYFAFDATTLYQAINGGDLPYVSNGLVKGIRQKMTGDNSRYLDAFVMDFGTADDALAMYDALKSSTPLTVGSYPTTVVSGSGFLGGVKALAHFDRFYFEASVSGYSEQAQALSDAALFLQWYESKID